MAKPHTYFGIVRGRVAAENITYVSPPVISREVAVSLCELVRKGSKECETHEDEIGNNVIIHQLVPRKRRP